MKAHVAPAWRRMGLRGSGNAFRLPNDAGHYALIGVQRDKWNTAQRCAFTLNVSFTSAQEWAAAQVVQPWIGDAPNANAHTPGVGWWQRVGSLVADGHDHWWLVQACDDGEGGGAGGGSAVDGGEVVGVDAVAAEVIDIVAEVVLPQLQARLDGQPVPAPPVWSWTAPSRT